MHLCKLTAPHPRSSPAGLGGQGLCPVPARPQCRACCVAGPSTQITDECRWGGTHPRTQAAHPISCLPCHPGCCWLKDWAGVVSEAERGRPGPLGNETMGPPDPQDWPSGPGTSLTTNRQVEPRRMCGWVSAGASGPCRSRPPLPSAPVTVACSQGASGSPTLPSRPTAADPHFWFLCSQLCVCGCLCKIQLTRKPASQASLRGRVGPSHSASRTLSWGQGWGQRPRELPFSQGST